ncbi:MAG: CHAT domain-containing tetratricopeptide repeat protein [Bacteroidota bacterium]
MFGRKRRKTEAQVKTKIDIARNHYAAGFFDAGLEEAMQAYELSKQKLKPGKSHYFAQSLLCIADGYQYIRLYDEAFSFYQHALNAIPKPHEEVDPLYLRGLRGLTTMYLEMGDQKQADFLLRGMVKIQLEAKGDQHPDYAAALFALAELYRQSGAAMLEMAFEGYKTVLNIYQKLDNEQYKGQISDCHFGMGACLFQQGRYDEAEPLFEQAYNNIKTMSGEQYAPLADILQNLAFIRVYQNDPRKAVALFEQAEHIYDHQIQYIFTKLSEEIRHRFVSSMMLSVERFLSLAARYFVGDQAIAAKILNLIGRRKSLGLDSLLFQEKQYRQSPKQAKKWEQIQQIRVRIAQKALAGTERGESLHALREQMMQWEISAQKLEQALLKDELKQDLLHSFQSFDLQAAQLALPPKTIYLEFVQYQQFDFHSQKPSEGGFNGPIHYMVLSLDRNGQTHFWDLGDASLIDQAIKNFRLSITGDHRSEDRSLIFEPLRGNPTSKAGNELFALLLGPLEKILSHSKQLFISTDGELSRLPFAALPYQDKLLIDHFQISYLTSARELVRVAQLSPFSSNPSVVMAAPDYDLGSNRQVDRKSREKRSQNDESLYKQKVRFTHLAGTVPEGKLIGKLLGVQPLMGADATEASLKSLSSPLILHLATHGFFLGQPTQQHSRLSNPDQIGKGGLGSGLALAGANTWLTQQNLGPQEDDGILNSIEAASLKLQGTELVVLSACETALGDIVVSEGVFGLTRAFALAGARTRILSLWKVPDQQTQLLMAAFYKNLLAGKGRAASLREAQLAIKRQYPEPFYWAAFICQGDAGPIAALSGA